MTQLNSGTYMARLVLVHGDLCAGTTCAHAAVITTVPRVAATGDLHALTGSVIISSCHFIVRLADAPPAADTTQPLSLLSQSLGGTCGGVPTVPPRLSRWHVV